MSNFGLIPFDYCKTHLEMDDRDKELTELLIFSASAERNRTTPLPGKGIKFYCNTMRR